MSHTITGARTVWLGMTAIDVTSPALPQMADHRYELEVRLKDAANNEDVRHLEYVAEADTPKGASDEVLKALVQQKGLNRVHELVDTER